MLSLNLLSVSGQILSLYSSLVPGMTWVLQHPTKISEKNSVILAKPIRIKIKPYLG